MMFYKTRDFFKELHRRNSVFFYLGMGLSILFVIFLLTFKACQGSLSEICIWLKPCKFTISFAMYVLTLGWLMEYLKDSLGEKNIRRITWIISILILVEMGVMTIQSWLASNNYYPAYFSKDTITLLGKSLYVLGNAIIIANTAVATYVGIHFFRKNPLKPVSYLWGIRAGFVIFLLGCFLGGFILERYGQVAADTHSYGIPFTHFTSTRDNLISLHFLGVHSLQLLPFCCYFFQKQLGKGFVISSTVFYTAVCIFFISMA